MTLTQGKLTNNQLTFYFKNVKIFTILLLFHHLFFSAFNIDLLYYDYAKHV